MKTLKDVKWEFFKIGDLFTALRPMARSENDYHEGKVPFVASGAVNNGVTKFCKPSENEHIDKGYCISVSPVDGSCHFHEYDFLGRGGAGSSILILYPKDMISRNIALFIVKCISQTTMSKYSYGLMASKERLLCDVFQLPVTPDGTPDYKFMEQYMRRIEKKLLERYALYLRRKGDNLLDKNFIGECKYMPFKMKDLLSLEPCRFTGKGIIKNGDIPYVGATNRNNGVLSFLDVDKSNVIKGNCIAFICNGDGSIGLSIYRSTDFIGSVDVKVGRSAHLNRYVGTYMTTVADTVRPHYSFGYKRTMQRLMNESLFLPVASDGFPDYKYMEQYMREKEQKIIHRYIEYRLKNV